MLGLKPFVVYSELYETTYIQADELCIFCLTALFFEY